MKKFIFALFAIMLMVTMMLPCICVAEGDGSASENAPVYTDPPTIPSEPFTWEYLASIAGASVFTLLVVQFIKAPLDKLWKIPTRFLAYIIALITMLVATALTTGLTIDTCMLAVVNALLAAVSAYGTYEVTFAKMSK